METSPYHPKPRAQPPRPHRANGRRPLAVRSSHDARAPVGDQNDAAPSDRPAIPLEYTVRHRSRLWFIRMPLTPALLLCTIIIFIAAVWTRSQFVYDAIFVCTGQRTWTIYSRGAGVQFLEIDWDSFPILLHECRPARRVPGDEITELDLELRGVRHSVLGIVFIYNAYVHDQAATPCRGIVIPYPWLMAAPMSMLCFIMALAIAPWMA